MSPPPPRLSAPSPSFSQITYELSHSHAHIYTSKFYPRPLASRPTALTEILVCGHESGLKILWRRPAQQPQESGDGDEMALDGGGVEGTEEQAGDDKFAFEYTLYLGTPVYSISFPPASVLPTEEPPLGAKRGGKDGELVGSLPDVLLRKNLLIAAACGDRAIRLITLPLIPSSSPSTRKLESVMTLGGGASGHREPADLVALSIIPSVSSSSTEFSPATSPDASPSSFSFGSPRPGGGSGWDVVVASSSPETSGVLLLWRIPLLPPQRNSSLPYSLKQPHRPASFFLHSPATSLAFNTSATSLSRRHQLLMSDRKGGIRILDTRASSWLCSFYTPYSQITEQRKKVLGAEWCTGGRSVVVLCEDGEWGIWDLEGVLAGEKEGGAVVTGFLVGGMVGETWYNSTSKKSTHGNHDEATSDISGRSPSARASSIASAATGVTSRRRRSGSLRAEDRYGLTGHLCVTPIASSSFFSTPATLAKGKSTTYMGGLQIHDEIITMVFGGVILALPSLKKFWKVEVAKIRKRAARDVGTGAGGFNSIAWSGEDAKAEKEFLVLEGWDTKGAAVAGLDVVPGEAKSEKVARILLSTSCRIALVDVHESRDGVAYRRVDKTSGLFANQKRGGLSAGGGNPGREGMMGGRGKRKVEPMQESPA